MIRIAVSVPPTEEQEGDVEEERATVWITVDRFQILADRMLRIETDEGLIMVINGDEWYRIEADPWDRIGATEGEAGISSENDHAPASDVAPSPDPG